MKIRIVCPDAKTAIFNMELFSETGEEQGYTISDTIEVELSDLIKYMQDHYVDPHNIDSEREVVNIVEDFICYKLMTEK